MTESDETASQKMLPVPLSETVRRRNSVVEYALLGLLILVSAAAYISHVSPVVRQADPAVYFYAGLRIAEVGLPSFCDDKNIVDPYFTLLGFRVRRHDAEPCFYPNHGIGLPLLIGLALYLFPLWEAASYLMPVLGLMGLIAVFALGQTLFDRPTGLLAAGLLAFDFVYWKMATEIWSDLPAMAFLVLGTFFVIRATAQDDIRLGLLGGASLGFACLIRYVSVLALLPLSIYFGLATRGQAKPKKALAGLGLGFCVFALAILFYNKSIYGGFLKTGYSAGHGWIPWPGLSFSYLGGQSPIGEGGYRVVWSSLVESFHYVGLLLAIGALAIMPRTKALLLASFALTFCLFYAFYAWPANGVNARFLLPAFPMICLAIAFVVVRFLRLFLRQRDLVLVALLPVAVLAWHSVSIHTSLVRLERQNRREEARVALVKAFTRTTEPTAVFLSREYHDLIILYGKRSVLYYSMIATPDPVARRYQLSDYEPRLVEVVGNLLGRDTPVYVVVEPEGRVFREGPIDPYPILSAQFEMMPIRTQQDLEMYRVLLP